MNRCDCPACQSIPSGVYAVVGMEWLSPIETGLWCPTCMLPSGLKRFYTPTVNGWPTGVTWASVCTQCGQRPDDTQSPKGGES